MKIIKRLILVILVITATVFLKRYIFKNSLYQPVEEYLKINYGIQGEFSIIQTTNNWLAGIDHQTYIEIKEPYPAYAFLMIQRDTFKVLKGRSDDIFLEQFKGEYIEQHPEVVQVMKQVIKEYGLEKYANKVFLNKYNRVFPYDNIEFNIKKSEELLADFIKTQNIDTTSLIPTLIPSDPRQVTPGYLGVVNFLFEFDINNNKHPIPKAIDLIEDFQQSGVLSKGVYNINISVDNSKPLELGGWYDSTVALFEVDENGNYTIIATPTYDELSNTYFYGDYMVKKKYEIKM